MDRQKQIQELSNDIYDRENPHAINRVEELAASLHNAGYRKPIVLTIDQLKALPLCEWVWIEVLVPFECPDKVSAYFRKQFDYTHEQAFCCGYPGLSFSFDYEDYSKTWVAYTQQPKECEI